MSDIEYPYERVCEFVEDDEGGTLVVDDVLYDEISVAAKAADQTVEEWVHNAIRNVIRDTPVVETDD